MFKHYLITRFNLRKSDWTSNKNSKEVLTDTWHENRFKLFEDYCFNSVANQVNTNFEWLVYFDITTPKNYRDKIDELSQKMDNFTPFFIDGMDEYLPSILKFMEKVDSEYIITSRIDNDDCISMHYIQEIQNRFNRQNFMAIDFIDGYTLQIEPTYKVGLRLDQFNPFISLIERNVHPKTVWAIRHSHWKREKNVEQIKGKRVWSSIIHSENKVNDFMGFGKVSLSTFFNEFSIQQMEKKRIEKNLIPIENWTFESFINKLSSHWNLNFKSFKKKIGLYKIK